MQSFASIHFVDMMDDGISWLIHLVFVFADSTGISHVKFHSASFFYVVMVEELESFFDEASTLLVSLSIDLHG